MKERGIPFSAPMVRAILDGRKTQTRRVMKPQPSAGVRSSFPFRAGIEDGHGRPIPIRYGVPGDRLWVRETWEEVHPCQVDAGRFSITGRAGIPGPPLVKYRVIYRSDGEYPRKHFWENPPFRVRCEPACQRDHSHPEESWRGWKPSIHMPRWASRITLEVTEVRVQRLQDISAHDVIAEGIDPAPHRCGCEACARTSEICTASASSLVMEFADIWRDINGPQSWDANPWVWCVSFRRMTERTPGGAR